PYDDVGERQHAVIVVARFGDGAGTEADHAGTRVDQRVDWKHFLFERGRRGDDFERRPRLVQILHGAVAPGDVVELAIGVRVERRLARHRENFAGARVHDDRAAAGGAVLRHPGMQLALGDVLQVFVDGQLDGGSGGRRTFEAAERVMPRVGLHQDGPGLAANLPVEGAFDAGQALVVDPDPAEQMRAELPVRVEAPAFLEEPDAVEIERGDALRLIRRDLPADEGERLALPEAIGERITVLRVTVPERGAERRRRVPRIGDFRRHRVDRVDVDARGQHPATAVEDIAALGRRGLRPL